MLTRTVLLKRIAPTTVSLHDDWSDMDGRTINSDASLNLSFLVNVGDIDGFAAILALPAVFESFERVEQTWQHQVDNAKSESVAYRKYLEDKPDDAYAAVAATMQKSAQTTTDCLVDVKIVRLMNLRANRARIGIYMSSLSETELYRLRFESLSTDLQRESGINGDPLRMFTAVLEGIQFYRHTVKPAPFQRGQEPLPLDEWHRRISKATKAMKVITLPTTVSRRKHRLEDNAILILNLLVYRRSRWRRSRNPTAKLCSMTSHWTTATPDWKSISNLESTRRSGIYSRHSSSFGPEDKPCIQNKKSKGKIAPQIPAD
jgi:hypothetical protein